MNNSKRLTANIVMVIALVALGCAAAFTINDGLNSVEVSSPSSNFAPGNNMPQMNGNMGTPPEMNQNNNFDSSQDGTSSRRTRPGNQQNSEELPAENSTEDATANTSEETSTDEMQQPAQQPTQQNAEESVPSADNTKLLINFALASAEFFAMGAIVTYLLLSRFNSYSPKEVIKK